MVFWGESGGGLPPQIRPRAGGESDVGESLTNNPPPPPPAPQRLPAWGLRDDRIPGTDQAVRGGRHGQKLYSGFPPRKVDARDSADARSSTDACLS